MPFNQLRLGAFSAAVAMLAVTSSGALAQKKYDTGATDTEIKIGNIMPYSGPASAYGVIGKTEAAYFGDPEIHEYEKGAAAVRRHRRHQVERSEELPLDHGLAAQLP